MALILFLLCKDWKAVLSHFKNVDQSFHLSYWKVQFSHIIVSGGLSFEVLKEVTKFYFSFSMCITSET